MGITFLQGVAGVTEFVLLRKLCCDLTLCNITYVTVLKNYTQNDNNLPFIDIALILQLHRFVFPIIHGCILSFVSCQLLPASF